MTTLLKKKLHMLNAICEIKEEFLILWRELSSTTKQNKKHQQSIVGLLTNVETIKINHYKELENEQK